MLLIAPTAIVAPSADMDTENPKLLTDAAPTRKLPRLFYFVVVQEQENALAQPLLLPYAPNATVMLSVETETNHPN